MRDGRVETEGLKPSLCLIAWHGPTSRPGGDQTSNFSWKRLAGKQTQMTAETVRVISILISRVYPV